MKILLLFLFIIPMKCFSQKDTIPKKTNVIIVNEVTFNEAVNQLLDKGYFIDKSDSTLQVISTKEKYIKKHWVYITYQLRIKNNNLIIKGLCSNHIGLNSGGITMQPDYYEIQNRGMKSSGMKSAFIEMNEFALSFNKPVEYKIQ